MQAFACACETLSFALERVEWIFFTNIRYRCSGYVALAIAVEIEMEMRVGPLERKARPGDGMRASGATPSKVVALIATLL